jgi:hypothetical protein
MGLWDNDVHFKIAVIAIGAFTTVLAIWLVFSFDVHVSARDLAGNERPPARTAFSGDDGTDDEMTIL